MIETADKLTSSAEPSQLARFMDTHGLADYAQLCSKADKDPDWFWRAVMDFHQLHFFHPFDQLLDVSHGPAWPQWCIGGTTNISYNCLDRNLTSGHSENLAILWEGENGERRSMNYRQLASLVGRAASGLVALGCKQGDVVGLYMPSVPETIAAYLAIARIGAIALPMFSGFGAQALIERLDDAGAKIVITVDYSYRKGKRIPMLDVVREAAPALASLRHVVVVERCNDQHPRSADTNQLFWRELIANQSEMAAIELPAQTPVMLVYTSGTTGKPKGTVHTHCGFMTKVALDFGLILDLKPSDRLLWMSDMGWLTGPILAVAVPLIGATLVLAEGVPDFPQPGRLWQLVQDYRISFLGVAPTMVRGFMQQAPDVVTQYDFSSLRITAATGEPWTPDAWNWFRTQVGKDRVPLLNYSGGTEIGGGILAGTVLHKNLKPCAFGGPIPGMGAIIVDETGQRVSAGQVGELALTVPSIGLTSGFWRDPQRYLDCYWSTVPDMWVHGDFASIDKDGMWFIHGRSDDTIKIAGKRTGPAEVEAALLATGKVAEATAVGLPDAIKGSAVVCVCVAASNVVPNENLIVELKKSVATTLGSSFRPKKILFVTDLPKTRNGKLMRRLVRSVLQGEAVGDLSGLLNPEALDELRQRATSA